MNREGVTNTGHDFRISQQANRYRRQGSNRKIVLILWYALPEGGVGGGGCQLKYKKRYKMIPVIGNLEDMMHMFNINKC